MHFGASLNFVPQMSASLASPSLGSDQQHALQREWKGLVSLGGHEEKTCGDEKLTMCAMASFSMTLEVNSAKSEEDRPWESGEDSVAGDETGRGRRSKTGGQSHRVECPATARCCHSQ